MAAPTPIRGRLAELLAAEASGSCEPGELLELQQLLSESAVSDRDQLMRVAGLAQLAFLRNDRAAHKVLPDAVRRKLLLLAAAVGG